MIVSIDNITYTAVEEPFKANDRIMKWSGGRFISYIASQFDVKLNRELWNETIYYKLTELKQ